MLGIPVVNAGDGAHEHPTQALLDVFTMREKLGDLKGRKVVILGDILFSRVARSNIHALTKLGANVTIVGPSTLVPRWFESLGVKVSHHLRSALADADVVMLIHRKAMQPRDGEAPAEPDNSTDVIIAKQRSGPTGDVQLVFLGQYTRFEDLAPSGMQP